MSMKEKRYGARVTLQKAKDLLEKAVKGRPEEVSAIFLWGPPGVGKSSIVREVARENNLALVDLRLSLLDPVDLRGVPIAKDGNCFWTRPPFIPRDGRGILFLDEMNQASMSVQSSAFQLVLDRMVGEHVLGDGWFVVAAGNREGDSTIVFRVADPLIGRFTHLEIEVSVDEWLDWAILHSIDERIIGFIKFRSDLLLKVAKDRVSVNYPSPRGWEFADRYIKLGWDPVVAVESACGGGTALEFASFLDVCSKLPNLDDFFAGKDVNIPAEPSVLSSLCSAIIVRATHQHQFEMGLKFCVKLLQEAKKEEFAVFLLKGLYLKDKKAVKSSGLWPEISRIFGNLFV